MRPSSPALGDPIEDDDSVILEVHPSADPRHWLEKGREAMERADFVEALDSFAWAHAHFARLKHPRGLVDVAQMAMNAALIWGDLPAAASWRKIRGALDPFQGQIEEATLLAAAGEWNRCLDLIRGLLKDHPDSEALWSLLARAAIILDRRDVPQETHQNSPRPLDPADRLLERLHRSRSGKIDGSFWEAWAICPDQPLRLETGLQILERFPEERTAERLLALKTLSVRSQSSSYASRLDIVWPAVIRSEEPLPEKLLDAWLERQKQPIWLVWGSAGQPRMMGRGRRPSEGLLAAVLSAGSVGPVEDGNALWWGHSLFWEGNSVGCLLTVTVGGDGLHSAMEHHMIAPWLARLAASGAAETTLSPSGEFLADGSEPMASVLRELARVAPSQLPVLILGPTGSGKELAAKEIHTRSGRTGPFKPINCSEFPETLMEAELFGHTKGAYTGADRERKGAIEAAEGGTLFLDEVADLSPRLQSLFLRVLQEKEVRRVGSDRIHKVNVRFLAATHRCLDELVATGHFRRDLHYRLKGVVLTLPSLRERRHEFPYLIPRLVVQVAGEAGLKPPDQAPGLAQTLADHAWPGNFRELRHAIERAILRCESGILKASHFPELEEPSLQEKGWEEANRSFQRQFLLGALAKHGFQITDAARTLGITRPALYLAAKRLGLDLARERSLWEARR